MSEHIRKFSFQFPPPYSHSSVADLHDDHAKFDALDINSSLVFVNLEVSNRNLDDHNAPSMVSKNQ